MVQESSNCLTKFVNHNADSISIFRSSLVRVSAVHGSEVLRDGRVHGGYGCLAGCLPGHASPPVNTKEHELAVTREVEGEKSTYL